MVKKMRSLFKHKNPSQHHHQQQPSVSSSSTTATSDDQPSSTLTQYLGDEDAGDLERVVNRGVTMIRSSDRLFFSPEKSNSILKKTTKTEHHRKLLISTTTITTSTTQPEKHSNCNGNVDVPMISTTAMESLDPYMDFRSSMEEMVEAHGLHDDWDLLEELLGCYLMLNEKRNHCYIIRAFADLVLLIKSTSNFVLHQLTTTTTSSDLASDSFVTSFSSPLHLSSTSTTAETSCSSSSIAPAEAAGSH